MSASEHPRSLEDTIVLLRRWFDDSFDDLDAFAEQIIAGLSLNADDHVQYASTARKDMKATAARFLAEFPVVDGCGLIFAHSALGTKDGRLEWWVREDESRFARYSFGVAPGGDRYYDYEQHEWFTRAFEEGGNSAVGPYIDYLGVEAYVLTLAVPAVVGGRRIGAVGADIQLDDLERALLPILLRCDTEVALLSKHHSVLVSNSPNYLPGKHLPAAPEGTLFEILSPRSDGILLLVSGTPNAVAARR